MANENVLVLEDDLAELNLASKQLPAAGYVVIPVVDGRDARDLLGRRGPPWKLYQRQLMQEALGKG